MYVRNSANSYGISTLPMSVFHATMTCGLPAKLGIMSTSTSAFGLLSVSLSLAVIRT
jgi:hypothetical protein